MPLFFRKRKPSEEAKKRLEYQLCRSKEAGADDILDISCCELSEVLILHSNEIKSLVPKGCCISNLATLKVLDLHENILTSLPDDIGRLTSLQVNIVHLCNTLTELPSSVGSLNSLRTLDVSDNQITQLPKTVALIRTLEVGLLQTSNCKHLALFVFFQIVVCLFFSWQSFTLDAAKMIYPPDSVCLEGTESIQRFLCSELGEEYCPPSQYLLPVLENDSKDNTDCLDGLEEAWRNKFSDYEKRKEQKHLEKLAFERDLGEKHREHTQLMLMNNSHKETFSTQCDRYTEKEQERLEEGLSQQQKVQEAERLMVLEKVRQAEDDITSRIDTMLMGNTRVCLCLIICNEIFSCRIRMEQLTAITQEEANSLRKKEVAEIILILSMETMDQKFDSILSLQVLDKSRATAQILQEEEMQKAAFQALQLQKDGVHGYIRKQIKLIEGELMQLTKLEVKKRNLDAENLQEVLVQQREALGDLLQQLLKQRDQREQELRQILVELEEKSESSQQNYWMIQYQRLLDAKPLSLRMQETGMEKELVNLLCRLSAQHYLPILAHHRITTKELRQMSLADLKKLGISEVGIQKALLKCAQEDEAGPSAAPFPMLPNASPIHHPSPPLTPGTPVTPSAPSPVDGPGSSECVVCMETGSQVIFLPCGHVCCCQMCSDALQNCPLCRANISQRIRLFHGSY
uniref:Leucine rich repeat and sterile alpha motif containing 1 n=1 Tax=Neogobius melanostomus TaxID=47308 RepID=A0A8C6WMG9_9GOBI